MIRRIKGAKADLKHV